MLRALSAAVLAALLATLTAPNPAASQNATPLTSSMAEDAVADPTLQAALDRINALRAQAGAVPLAFNASLTAAAQGHAVDMATYKYFSHTSRDGRTPAQRITASGYSWSSYGENIAWGYVDWNATINAWMKSSGHRANLLNTRFKDIGLGVKNRYYVADFGAPRTR